jgi:hypothetical protein
LIVNLKDPASIVAWYRVYPQRHGPQLAAFAKLRPQFAEAIKEAGRLIRLSTKSVDKSRRPAPQTA